MKESRDKMWTGKRERRRSEKTKQRSEQGGGVEKEEVGRKGDVRERRKEIKQVGSKVEIFFFSRIKEDINK